MHDAVDTRDDCWDSCEPLRFFWASLAALADNPLELSSSCLALAAPDSWPHNSLMISRAAFLGNKMRTTFLSYNVDFLSFNSGDA